MRGKVTRLLGIALLLACTACGRNSSLGRPREPDRILRYEIEAGSYSTAYDAVQAIHPNWLRPRNADNGRVVSQIQVYVDGTKYGGLSWLKNVRASSVGSIERIDGRTATTRWGGGHSEGVLYVTSIVP